MTEEEPQGCVQPAEGPITRQAASDPTVQRDTQQEKKTMVMVGNEAPDFGAGAYHEGGFKNVKLSDFRGKWVFLCFYPGDFTFV